MTHEMMHSRDMLGSLLAYEHALLELGEFMGAAVETQLACISYKNSQWCIQSEVRILSRKQKKNAIQQDLSLRFSCKDLTLC